MPLMYKPVQSNMACEDGKKKWYPHLVKFEKRVTIATIAEEITKVSSLSKGDVYSVVFNMFDSVRFHLLHSKTVHLDDFGTFTIKAHSAGNGVDTPEEVNPNQITHLTVQFTPCFKRDTVQGVKYPMFKDVEFVRTDKIGGGTKKIEIEEE